MSKSATATPDEVDRDQASAENFEGQSTSELDVPLTEAQMLAYAKAVFADAHGWTTSRVAASEAREALRAFYRK